MQSALTQQCHQAIGLLRPVAEFRQPSEYPTIEVRHALQEIASRGDQAIRAIQLLDGLPLVLPRFPCWRQALRFVDAFLVKGGFLYVLSDRLIFYALFPAAPGQLFSARLADLVELRWWRANLGLTIRIKPDSKHHLSLVPGQGSRLSQDGQSIVADRSVGLTDIGKVLSGGSAIGGNLRQYRGYLADKKVAKENGRQLRDLLDGIVRGVLPPIESA